MEKSWKEALNSSSNRSGRTSTSPNKPVVTFRMRQPSQKR